MNFDHFKNQIQRLISQFGKTAYGDERLTILWRRISSFSDDWMTQTVDRFLGECRSAPLLPEFMDATRDALVAERQAKQFVPASQVCSLCNHTGWINPPGITVGYDRVVMRCECVGGPRALADRIRNHPENPDPKTADRIERSFQGVSGWAFKEHGFSAKIPSSRSA